MKLNPDCIRDILMEIESSVSLNNYLVIETDKPSSLWSTYSWEEVAYHINQCLMSGLITNADIYVSDGYATITDLSPKGHEFLANIRNDNIWTNTKSIAKKIGSTSLDALSQVASNVITTLILSHFK